MVFGPFAGQLGDDQRIQPFQMPRPPPQAAAGAPHYHFPVAPLPPPLHDPSNEYIEYIIRSLHQTLSPGGPMTYVVIPYPTGPGVVQQVPSRPVLPNIIRDAIATGEMIPRKIWEGVLGHDPLSQFRPLRMFLETGQVDAVGIGFFSGLFDIQEFSNIQCPCGQMMKISERGGFTTLYCSSCGRKKSVLHVMLGEERVSVTPCQAILIILLWARGCRFRDVAEDLGLSPSTVRRYYTLLRTRAVKNLERDMLWERFANAVQIDESLFGRQKYHTGRRVLEDWVFGICDAQPGGRVYMTCVPHRDSKTLLPIVQQHVDPGTTVTSDQWAAYYRLAPMFHHLTVCHKDHFVDPTTGAHTQRIESLWASCKGWSRAMKYRCRKYRDRYVKEWCWRYNHGRGWREIWGAIFH